MIYTVKFDDKAFVFDDRYDAMNFAETAALASDGTINITIEIRKEGAENE